MRAFPNLRIGDIGDIGDGSTRVGRRVRRRVKVVRGGSGWFGDNTHALWKMVLDQRDNKGRRDRSGN